MPATRRAFFLSRKRAPEESIMAIMQSDVPVVPPEPLKPQPLPPELPQRPTPEDVPPPPQHPPGPPQPVAKR
jgi:hypothetical protein